jgi:glutamine amidotransferase
MSVRKSQRIAVIDYGMGNLRSVRQALEHVGGADVAVTVTDDAAVVRAADRVVFPGQGAMGDCMRALNERGLADAIRDAFANKPFLGICVGFQALFEYSEEDGGTPGLALVPGRVERFAVGMTDAAYGGRLKVPHMGWSQVIQETGHPLWTGIDNNARFYFVHSYQVQPGNWSVSAGNCDYGIRFCAAAAGANWFATQFHPEKSARDGLRLIQNFLDWRP